MKATFYNMEMNIDDPEDQPVDEQSFNPQKTPYEVSESMFPSSGPLQEQYRFLLRYALLAPSSYNTQPWKCVLNDAGIAVYADYSRRLPVADPANRQLLMSIGAFLMNLRIAAAHFAFESRVEYNYGGVSGQPLAFVRLSPRAPHERLAAHLAPLFPAIVRRHTNRNRFLVTRIPQKVLDQLNGLARTSQVSLLLSTDGAQNVKVADLVAEADARMHANSQFMEERGRWLRPDLVGVRDGRTDGGPKAGPATISDGSWGSRLTETEQAPAVHNKNLCAEAPLLAVIHGEDTLPELLEAGELLERVWLTVTNEGLYCSFFNLALGLPGLRMNLRTMLGLTSWPQLLLRIGFSLSEPALTPRRAVEEILGTPEGPPP